MQHILYMYFKILSFFHFHLHLFSLGRSHLYSLFFVAVFHRFIVKSGFAFYNMTMCVCVYTWLEKPDAQNREKTNFMIKFNCRNKLLYLFIISTFSISVIWCVSRLQFRAWCLRERTKIQKCFFFNVSLSLRQPLLHGIGAVLLSEPLGVLCFSSFRSQYSFFPPRSSLLLLLLFCHLNQSSESVENLHFLLVSSIF